MPQKKPQEDSSLTPPRMKLDSSSSRQRVVSVLNVFFKYENDKPLLKGAHVETPPRVDKTRSVLSVNVLEARFTGLTPRTETSFLGIVWHKLA